MAMKKKGPQYISNREFTAECARWKIEWDEHLLKTGKRLPISNMMGIAFMKLSKRYASKSNFSGYTYNEDMQSEGILSCVKYAHNFDPEKSTNAFAYFTQIIHNAFIQFLGKEKNFSAFKFGLAKSLSPGLAKHDYNDIKISDGDMGDFK